MSTAGHTNTTRPSLVGDAAAEGGVPPAAGGVGPDLEFTTGQTIRSDTFTYDAQRMIGHGSFGAVFLAKVVETGDLVAIKKVLQDRRFKNRELQIMRQLAKHPHPFVVLLKHHFLSSGTKQDEVYLNLVLEFVPETIYSVAKQHSRSKIPVPLFAVKMYTYQLVRALGHIHGMNICHRDVKPQVRFVAFRLMQRPSHTHIFILPPLTH